MVCFVWDGFPQYAARCIRAFVERVDERVVVLATQPSVPVRGMEEVCGCRVVWINYDKVSLRHWVGEIPRVIFVSGWKIAAFNRFCEEVRMNGGQAVCMCDNSWELSPCAFGSLRWWQAVIRECIKAIRFRVLLRRKFNAFFVPGRSAVRLLSFYGVQREKIATGMYAADAALFRNGKPLPLRERKMLYVGRFIERKNVRRLLEAFVVAAKTDASGWTLDMCGSGPLEDELKRLADLYSAEMSASNSRIRIHPFVQPEKLAALYREARVFILPSLSEHWGLVVHEAALSGCVLLLAENIGAKDDLLAPKPDGRGYVNGAVLSPLDSHNMTSAIKYAFALTDEELLAAQEANLQVSQTIGVNVFAEHVKVLIEHHSSN